MLESPSNCYKTPKKGVKAVDNLAHALKFVPA